MRCSINDEVEWGIAEEYPAGGLVELLTTGAAGADELLVHPLEVDLQPRDALAQRVLLGFGDDRAGWEPHLASPSPRRPCGRAVPLVYRNVLD